MYKKIEIEEAQRYNKLKSGLETTKMSDLIIEIRRVDGSILYVDSLDKPNIICWDSENDFPPSEIDKITFEIKKINKF
jgi:hypothetical protein